MPVKLLFFMLALASILGNPRGANAEGGSALFQSDDNGRAWSLVIQRPPGQSIFCLMIDPVVPDRLLIGTEQGSWVREGADDWRPIPTLDESNAGAVFGFALDPANTQRMYAATELSVFRSIDGGHQWQRLDAAPVGSVAISLGSYRDTATAVFVGTADGLFVSVDDGINWELSKNGLTGAVMAIAIGRNGETFVGTSTGAHVRDANGDEFSPIRGVQMGASRAAFAGNDGTAYVGVSSLLYQQTNGWHRLVTLPLAGTGDQPGITVIFPTGDGRVLVGTEKGLHSSDKWQLVPPFDSMSNLEIGSIVRDAFTTDRLFATGSAVPHAITLARVNVAFNASTAEPDLSVISLALGVFFLAFGFMAIRYINRPQQDQSLDRPGDPPAGNSSRFD